MSIKPDPTPSLAAQRASDVIQCALDEKFGIKLGPTIAAEVAQIIERETRVGEMDRLRKQLMEAVESFEAIGRDGNAHTMAQLARFEAKSFRALLSRLPAPPKE